MKICFVLEHFYPHVGGAETIFAEYASRLAAFGHRVKVVTSNSGGVYGVSLQNNVEVTHFAWPEFFGHPIPRRSDLRHFVEWADIVHTATYTAAPVASAAARCAKKPCVVTVYESLNEKWFWVEFNPIKATMFRVFERYVLGRKYSLFHAISRSTANDLARSGIKEDAIAVIYPGVTEATLPAVVTDAEVTLPPDLSGDAKIFLYFGRPGQTKGIFVLFDAIQRIANRIQEGFKFVFIVSDDPLAEKQRLRTKVRNAGLHHLVTILDPLGRRDLIEAIRRAYCVIIPSITEGFGFSAAESCALGIPVIASNAGSLPEVVSGKVLFFENRSSESLAEKIILATQCRYDTLPARVFDWDASTRQLLKAYQDLIIHPTD